MRAEDVSSKRSQNFAEASKSEIQTEEVLKPGQDIIKQYQQITTTVKIVLSKKTNKPKRPTKTKESKGRPNCIELPCFQAIGNLEQICS